MVHQGSARRLCDARALLPVHARGCAHMLVQNAAVGEELLDDLDPMQNLNQPRVVVVERSQHRAVGQMLELYQLGVGERRACMAGNVQAGQRSHAIRARRIAQRLVVGELHVRERLDRLADALVEVPGIEIIQQDIACRTDDAQPGISELEAAIFVDHAHEQAGEIGKTVDLVLKPLGDLLIGGERQLGVRIRLRNKAENLVALRGIQRLRDPAGHDPSGMNPLAPQQFDHVLAKPAKPNAGSS